MFTGIIQATATVTTLSNSFIEVRFTDSGGAIRDLFSGLAAQGALGPVLTGPAVGYSIVYHIEIVLLFATLVAIGPLVRRVSPSRAQAPTKFGLAELPG